MHYISLNNKRLSEGSLYDGGIRTPMIVRWPGRVPAGETSDAVWYFADFLPTVAELSGAVGAKKGSELFD